MQSNNKLTIPDLISIGVFTAIYFVLVTIATFASTLLLPGVSNIFLPAIAALISGSVYMLLAAKLQKFGGITIMGLVMGLFFFVSGHFVLSFAANILFGVLADWVASLGKYYDRKLLFVSYILFSFGLTALFAPINTGTFIVCLVSILVCAVIGGLFGQKMIKKHFAKAGIV